MPNLTPEERALAAEAVIEQVREWYRTYGPINGPVGAQLEAIIATADPSALREHEAKVKSDALAEAARSSKAALDGALAGAAVLRECINNAKKALTVTIGFGDSISRAWDKAILEARAALNAAPIPEKPNGDTQ